MSTLEELERERDKAKNIREAQLEQIEIQRKRKALQRDIKELKNPKRTAFFRGVGRLSLRATNASVSVAKRLSVANKRRPVRKAVRRLAPRRAVRKAVGRTRVARRRTIKRATRRLAPRRSVRRATKSISRKTSPMTLNQAIYG